MMNFCTICIVIVLVTTSMPTEATVADGEFGQRRDLLLQILSDPALFPVRHQSFTLDLQSRKWQYFHASLAQGLRVDEANEYFASREVQSDEWLTLMMLNTYCEFKDSLTEAARQRMQDIVLRYADGLKGRNLDAVTKANNENHLINWKTIYLLADQEFGGGDPIALTQARESFKRWVQYRVKRGMEEFNSPHYAAASLLPCYLFMTTTTIHRSRSGLKSVSMRCLQTTHCYH